MQRYALTEEDIRKEEERARIIREGAEMVHSVAKSAAGAVMLPVCAIYHTLEKCCGNLDISILFVIIFGILDTTYRQTRGTNDPNAWT